MIIGVLSLLTLIVNKIAFLKLSRLINSQPSPEVHAGLSPFPVANSYPKTANLGAR